MTTKWEHERYLKNATIITPLHLDGAEWNALPRCSCGIRRLLPFISSRSHGSFHAWLTICERTCAQFTFTLLFSSMFCFSRLWGKSARNARLWLTYPFSVIFVDRDCSTIVPEYTRCTDQWRNIIIAQNNGTRYPTGCRAPGWTIYDIHWRTNLYDSLLKIVINRLKWIRWMNKLLFG